MSVHHIDMFHKALLALPVLSFIHPTFASPISQFDDLGRLLENLISWESEIKVDLNQLIQDILNGVKSGQSNEKVEKNEACTGACCVCK